MSALRRLFDLDNPLMQGLSIVADMLILNLLTLICSLPLLTAGTALTAMNDVGDIVADSIVAFFA